MLSPSEEQPRVGVVPKKPESVTSSTVSPMDKTKVAFTNDTIMYASNSSAKTERIRLVAATFRQLEISAEI